MPHVSFDPVAYFNDLDRKIDCGEAWNEEKPYDPCQEKRPIMKVHAFHPGFVKGEKIITQEVIQALLNAICVLKLKLPSAELSHMEQRTRKLLAPSYRSPIIVGVRGLAGKGKTSSINAVLSVDGLAHTVGRHTCRCLTVLTYHVELGKRWNVRPSRISSSWR